jgi:hypothetical protein
MNLHLTRQMLETIFDLPANDGAFSAEQKGYLATVGVKRPSVFLAFPPKAAGTFLRHAAVHATGGDVLRVVYAQGDRDAQPYLPTFMAYYAGGFCPGPMVTHVHMQAFPANTSFVEAFGICPVISIRNIPDMLASYWDMLEGGDRGLPMGINCTIPQDFRTISPDRRADFMIDVVAPWYVGYYATWLQYDQNNPGAILTVRYSEFLKNPAETLGSILEASRLPTPLTRCQDAIDAVWTERRSHRFNRGIEGRSHQYFAAHHIERISKMLSYYPSTTSLRGELVGLEG